MEPYSGTRRACRGSVLLQLLLLAVALCAAPAAGATCRWSVRRRSGWTGPAFPLSIAEVSLLGSSTPLTASFTPSSTWGPTYGVSNLSDNQLSTFWASASGDATPSLTITWTCVPGESVRLALTNRQLGKSSYNNCNQACVDRLSSFSVFEETDAAGNTLPTPIEHKLMWWSPMFYPTTPVESSALLPLPAASSSQRIVIYEDAGLRNCFIWVSPVNPSATDTFINALQMEYLVGGVSSILSPSEAVPADRLYASMTGSFRGFEVTKCFDNQPASTPCASTSSPTPRMVIGGPCGQAFLGATRLRLNIANRPSSSPGCAGCADRLSKFTLTAAVAKAGALEMLPESYTPSVPVPLALSYTWATAVPSLIVVDNLQGAQYLMSLSFNVTLAGPGTGLGLPGLALTPSACFATSGAPSLTLPPAVETVTYPTDWTTWTPGTLDGTQLLYSGPTDNPTTIQLPQGTTAFGMTVLPNTLNSFTFTATAAADGSTTSTPVSLVQNVDGQSGPAFFGVFATSTLASAGITSFTIGPAPGVSGTQGYAFGQLLIACNQPELA